MHRVGVAVQRLSDGGAVGEPPHPHRVVGAAVESAAADDDWGAIRQRPDRHRVYRTVVATQRLADRGAIAQPPHPHRAIATPADNDRGAIRQRPDRHRLHCAGVAGDDLVAACLASVGPAGLPGPVGGGARDAGGQAAAAQAMGGQFEQASPRRSVEKAEVAGGLPVYGGSRPRWRGLCGVQVGRQPGRIDSD